jgi:hypothetical protein
LTQSAIPLHLTQPPFVFTRLDAGASARQEGEE